MDLSSALKDLFSITNLIKTVRIVQPPVLSGDGAFDLAYPIVYGPVLVGLLHAIESAQILPEGRTLQLLDCPISHLQSFGIIPEGTTIAAALSKFSQIVLEVKDAEVRESPERSLKRIGLVEGGLGDWLIKVLSDHTTHLQGIQLRLGRFRRNMLDQVLEQQDQWKGIRHLELHDFLVDAHSLCHHISSRLKILETLVLQEGSLTLTEGGPSWKDLFAVWLRIKENKAATVIPLKNIALNNLTGSKGEKIDEYSISGFIEAMVPQA